MGFGSWLYHFVAKRALWAWNPVKKQYVPINRWAQLIRWLAK